MNEYGRKIYNDLMALVSEPESPFYFVDHLMNGVKFRVFTYRLASYTDFLKPSALECRGHMFEINGDEYVALAALPPQKFFNANENPMAMGLDYSKTVLVMDKLDGSLMTTYQLPIADRVMLKSKTTLTSDQANAANEWLGLEKNGNLKECLNYLREKHYSVSLEWTSPKHRIVLPYQESNLTVLCARHLYDGSYMPYEELKSIIKNFHCETHMVVNYTNSISEDRRLDFIQNIPHMTGIEGYVIMLEDGQMVKIKTDWYCALHHTKDSVGSDKRLFECVVLEAHDDLRAMFPDDAYLIGRIDDMESKVKKIYADIDENAIMFYHANMDLDRKSFAIKAQAKVPKMYFGIAMNLYLGKSNDYQQWLIKHWKDFGIKEEEASE